MDKQHYKIKRLDRRYVGHMHMKYFVDIYQIDDFYELKNWCAEQWGVTRPLDDWMTAVSIIHRLVPKDVNPAWTYLRDRYRKRIMFRDKEEAMLFALRWSAN